LDITTPSRAKREHDLQKIAALYLAGKAQVAIASEMGVSQQAISSSLRTLRKRWIDSALRDFDELRAEQLAKIDRLESEYWDAWERSKAPRTRKGRKQKTADSGDAEESSVTIEDRDGNPSWLAGVERCIERRCKLLGLDAPTKTSVTVEQTFADFVMAAAGDADLAGAEPQG